MRVPNKISTSKTLNWSTTAQVIENPLGQIKPDEWKNIPVCLVNAFKLIINTNEHNYQHINSHEAKFEIVRNANQTGVARIEREVKRRNEELRIDMLKLKDELKQAFTAEITDLHESMKV